MALPVGETTGEPPVQWAGAPLSTKATVPLGAATPGGFGETTAVYVTGEPATVGFANEITCVPLAARSTVIERG